MRICRIARIYPRTSYPGSGLIPYKLSDLLGVPCLYVAKQLDGAPLGFPAHVTPLFVSYPEPVLIKGSGPLIAIQNRLLQGVRVLGNLWLALRTAVAARRFRCDLVHVHTPLPLLAAIAVKVITRSPLVLTFHGTDFDGFRQRPMLQWLIKHFVDFVTCVAPGMADEFQHLVPGVPVTYVANGVDLQLFVPSPSASRKKQLITVGRLVWQKGYDDLLRSLVNVFQRFPEYHLLFVGSGELEPALRTLAESLGIGSRVTFAGTMLQPEVVRALTESDLFVMSSVSEGFPKALIEAMACQLPVVVTDVGACGEVGRKGGLVVPPHDPPSLGAAIARMLSDDGFRAEAARNARAEALHYDWSAQADRMRSIYADVLARHARHH